MRPGLALVSLTAATAAAVLMLGAVTLPPRTVSFGTADWQGAPTVRGAYHVHTNRSDGTGSVDEVAAAAARAGLQFVVFTDHGDGTRPPDPPTYRWNVLCVDSIEISTTAGHYVALDMPPAPYPLGGEPRDVVEDVARLGGFGVVAHPTSAKPALRWHDWQVPANAVEWLNADSEWRDESFLDLGRAILHYGFRKAETLASLLDRPDAALARWDELARQRRVVGLAGSDAHARLSLSNGTDPYTGSLMMRVPAYEAVFRTFSLRAEVDRTLTGDAAADAPGVMAALRGGRVYTVVDALAAPAALQFAGQAGNRIVRPGGVVSGGQPVRLTVRTMAPPDATIVLLRNGTVVKSVEGPALEHTASADRAAYRVEVRLARSRRRTSIPWIVSNPIYIGGDLTEKQPSAQPTLDEPPRPVFEDGDAVGWHVEHDLHSKAAVDSVEALDGRELAFRFALAGGSPGGQYAALVYDASQSLASYRRLAFRVRSDRYLRLSVQVRLAGSPPRERERWQRSVYIEPASRAVSVAFDEMTFVGGSPSGRLDPGQAEALLFVVDTVNTRPGTAGIVWLDDLRIER